MTYTYLYSVSQIRAIEQAARIELVPGTLMQRAGRAACEAALELLPAPYSDAAVLVLAGPGNNGGDALVVAALLVQQGIRVTVLLHADPENYSGEARDAYTHATSSSIRFIGIGDDITSTEWSLVIDGLFGIGLQRAIAEPVYGLIRSINELKFPVLALDVPSGLDADKGIVIGKAGVAVRATHTITFIGDKPGLHTADGRDHAGKVRVADLDIDAKHFMPPHAWLNSPELFSSALARRKHSSHKGSYGDVAIIGGASGMGGAVLLSARASLYCGAGRSIAGFLEQAPAFDMLHPELMCRAAESVALEKATLVVGPGLGLSDAARHLVESALRTDSPLVMDADGLNLVAADTSLAALLARRIMPAILTPHPLEAARLLGISSTAIQADRLQAARQLAAQYNAIIILKGSGSVIAHPDGRLVINPTGNPGLATPGSGDVLAGITGALLSQHKLPWEGALAAVWLHGKAADELVEQGTGPTGLTAGELAPQVRRVLNRLIAERPGAFSPV
jgi:hydroxyethylthiazole kinase-like uncharacterized protein yjeF